MADPFDNPSPDTDFLPVRKDRRHSRGDSLSTMESQSTIIDNSVAEPNPTGRALSIRGALRFKWTIIVVALIVLVLGEIAVWTTISPIYRASAVIEVQPIIPRLLVKTEENGPLPFYQQFLDTQIEFITSDAVLNRVLDRPEIRKTRWYVDAPATMLDYARSKKPPFDRLREELDVVAPKGKLVIQLSKTSPFPGEARTILNAVADEYTKYVNETRFQQDKDKLKQLKSLEVSTATEIDSLEAQLATLQDQPDLQSPDLDKLVTERKNALENLGQTLEVLNREIENIQTCLTRLGLDTTAASTTSEPTPMDFARDVHWAQIKTQVDQAELSLSELSANLGENHRTLRIARNRIAQLHQQLAEREATLKSVGMPAAPQLAANGSLPSTMESSDPSFLKQRLQLLNDSRDKITKDLQIMRDSYSQTWKKYRKYIEVRETLNQKMETLKQVEKREFELEQNQKAPANIRRVGAAFEPQSSNSDRRPKLSVVVLLGALIAGFGVAVLRYQLSPKVYELNDVATQIGTIPILGYLPLLDQNQKSLPVDWHVLQEEAVRAIRTSLMPRLQVAKNLVVQITSSSSEAGKTCLSLMLAKSFAACGKRVLLVDADLRRSSLTRRLSCENAMGLADLLRNINLQHNFAHTTLGPGLDLIPAGSGNTAFAAELLANGAFGARIAQWRKSYDVVLVDSSPILAVADGAMLAQQVDGSIVLIREGHCNRTVVGEALSQIESVGGHSLGIVLVGPRPPRSYYYGSPVDSDTAPSGAHQTSDNSLMPLRGHT